MDKYKNWDKESLIFHLDEVSERRLKIINEQAIDNQKLLERIEILESRIDHHTKTQDYDISFYKNEMESKLEYQKSKYEMKIKDILSQKEVTLKDLNKHPLRPDKKSKALKKKKRKNK